MGTTVDAPPGTLTQVLAEWGRHLTFDDLPQRVRDYAVSIVMSHLAVIRTSRSHPLGDRVIRAFGDPLSAPPERAAMALAGLSSCLYFEDSFYLGHVTHSSINVPLAYRTEQRLSGARLITAMVVAGECASRVTAAAALGPMRGQGALYTQLIGAAAARLHGAGAPAEQWVHAWGLALLAPPWPLRRAFFGSNAKVLSASMPVRVALDACDAAAAGLTGAPDILEHPGGLLARFAEVPAPEVVTLGLGSRWHTETVTFKIHPAGAYVDAAIDCGIELHGRLSPAEIEEIEEITVHAARLTMVMDDEGAPYLNRELSAIMALNISVAYNVVTALLTGGFSAADLAEPATADPRRWELAGKVRLAYDPTLSRNLLRATAPLGEAIRHAGDRARQWLTDFSGGRIPADLAGAPGSSETFEDATKAIGSRVVVRLRDGRELVAARTHAAGSAGADTRRDHRSIARTKLLGSGATAEIADALDTLSSLTARELDDLIRAALANDGCERGTTSHDR